MTDVRLIDIDIELLVIDWAIASVAVQAIFGAAPGTRVSAGLDPTGDLVLPAARLELVTASEPVRGHLTAPVLQGSVWADDKATARDGAATLRGRLQDPDIVGTHAGLGVITGFETAQGLRPLQDPAAPLLSRYIFSTRYWAHRLPLPA